MNETEVTISLLIITVIVVSSVPGLLFKSVSVKAKHEDGMSWLEYGAVMKGFSLLVAALPIVLVVVWFNVEQKDKLPVLVMIAIFGSLSVPLVIELFFVRVGFNDVGLVCKSGWRRNRAISWADIEGIEFSQSMQWWVLTTKESGVVRLQIYLSGLDELLGELEKRGIKRA